MCPGIHEMQPLPNEARRVEGVSTWFGNLSWVIPSLANGLNGPTCHSFTVLYCKKKIDWKGF